MSKRLPTILAGLFGAFAILAASIGAADAAVLPGAGALQKSVGQTSASADLVVKTRYRRRFYFGFGFRPYYRPWGYRRYRYYRPRYYRPRYYGYRYYRHPRRYRYFGIRVYRYRRW